MISNPQGKKANNEEGGMLVRLGMRVFNLFLALSCVTHVSLPIACHGTYSSRLPSVRNKTDASPSMTHNASLKHR
jgi:hypothetical protein